MKHLTTLIVSLTLLAQLGCSTAYHAPGRAADLALFGIDPRDALTDASIREVLDRPVLARLPATVAVVRVQDAGYTSYSARAWGHGRYSVLTNRDVETDEDFERIADLPRVTHAAPISRLLLPERLTSDRELRRAAASLGADLLLVYTFDTTFHTEDGFAPLTVVSLGLFPTKTARVTSTAAAVLLDTRSGHVYAATESTEDTSQLANAWTSRAAIDQSRRRAERRALDGLLDNLEQAWPTVTIAIDAAPPPEPRPAPITTWRIFPRGMNAPPPGPTYRTATPTDR